MKKVIIPVIIVYLLFLFSGCSNARPEGVNESQKTTPTQTITNDTSNTENKTNAENKTSGGTSTEPEKYKIGDSAKSGNLIFTVNSARIDEGDEFIKPDEGNIYYIVDVTVENTGDKTETVSSLLMFKLFDSDGYNYTSTIGPDTKGQVDGDLSAGRKLRGELVFEIPKNAKGLELEIYPDVFGNNQIVFELDR